MAWQLIALPALPEDPVSILRTQGTPSDLLWPPWTPGTQVVHRYTQKAKHPYTLKIFF